MKMIFIQFPRPSDFDDLVHVSLIKNGEMIMGMWKDGSGFSLNDIPYKFKARKSMHIGKISKGSRSISVVLPYLLDKGVI